MTQEEGEAAERRAAFRTGMGGVRGGRETGEGGRDCHSAGTIPNRWREGKAPSCEKGWREEGDVWGKGGPYRPLALHLPSISLT